MCVITLTHSVGLPVERGHHQWRAAQVRVDDVGLSAVTEEQRDALHVVGEGRGVKGSPGRREGKGYKCKNQEKESRRQDVGGVSPSPALGVGGVDDGAA